MGKSCGCIKSLYYKSFMNPYQYYKSCENLCQVLQVLCAASEHAIKLKEGLYEIIIDIIQSYNRKVSVVVHGCWHWCRVQ